MKAWSRQRQTGFTLLELILSAAVFMLVAGAAFGLLGIAQKRNQTDSQVLNSFQEARLGIDQIVRDINDAGYPPQSYFSAPPGAANSYAVSPFAWSPGYTGGAPCTIGVTCTSPGDFDLIIETQFDNTGVQWIRYQLPAGTTTLLRGMVPKGAGDPIAALSAPGVMIPYIQDVMNNATGAQIGAIRAAYPTMFPGGVPVPVFSYTCDVGGGGAPTSCPAAGAFNGPINVRDVEVTLIVQATTSDAQTGRLRLVELHGRGRRANPNQ